MEFMEGASGRKGANYIYNAKPDGLKIGSAGAMIPGPILGLPGSNYDIDKFIYLGSTETGNPYAFFTRKELGLDSLEKLRSKSGLRIGAQSIGHSVYVTARLFAYLLEFKEPKFIVGFTSPEMDVAMSGGELDARTTSGLDELVQKGIKDNFHYHATLAVPKGRAASRFARGSPTWTNLLRPKRSARSSTCFAPSNIPAGRFIFRRELPRNWCKSCGMPWRRRIRTRGFSTTLRN